MAVNSHLKNGHAYHLYTYGYVDNVPDGTIIKDGNEILSSSEIFTYQTELGYGSVSAFSNYFRYKLILERGGWWCDTDLVCLKQFPFGGNAIIVTERTHSPYNHPATCAFYCPPQHMLMQRCWHEANLKDRGKIVWGEVGPALFKKELQGCEGISFEYLPDGFCPLNWFDAESLFDPDFQLDLSQSMAIHLWNEMWRRLGYDKDAQYKPGCLYERLKAEYL